MRKKCSLSLILILSGIIIISCAPPQEPRVQTGGAEVVSFRALPFDLSDVLLLDGPFKKATELNIQSLLNYEPDRLLAKFRTEAGLEAKAEHYHGWEDDTIAGHSLGHYLSGCVLMYKTTGDERFLDRVNYIVDELESVQNANGDGYIGAMPDGKRILAVEVGNGDIRAKRFDLNGLWAPYYALHKVVAGLRDAYRLCGNTKALEIEKKFADWLEGVVEGLNEEQIQEMLFCEHGGMNEVLADLYADTGEEKYLNLSLIFHHEEVLEPLSRGEDILPGLHGNTQIPKLIGLARRYELTGDEKDRRTAEFFWDRVVNNHSYVTGGHGNHEYFGEPNKLRDRLSSGTTETCNVYNMLKLTRHLFQWEAKAEVADFYERAMINHILSSQHPQNGRVIYNLSLEMGGRKSYQNPFWFTCCVGTGMENHSKYGGNIYFHNDEELFISQFIASELDWKDKGIKIKQITRYPEVQSTRIELDCETPVFLTFQIRYPYWAEKGLEIKINGTKKRINKEPGSFVPIRKKWKKGDTIEISFPFSLRLESMPDDPNRVAVMYGPLVLAGDLGPEDDPNSADLMFVPVLMTEDRDPNNWLEPVSGQLNTFKTVGIGKPREVLMKPFYATHERRYTVYWDMFSKQRWEQYQKDYEAQQERRRELEELTYDFFQPGDKKSEQEHNFQSEKTRRGFFKNRRNREADRGGWFSFDMKVMMGQPMELVVEYWGGFPGSRIFDILIDGRQIATENISNKADGQFIFLDYEIPDEMTFDKRKLNVKFVPHSGHRAGPIFGVRTIKR